MIDTPARTVGFAAALALACSLIVTIAVSLLRPYQQAYDALDRDRAVLLAAGLLDGGVAVSDREIVEQFVSLDAFVVDLTTGSLAAGLDPARFDIETALEDPNASFTIPGDLDTAGIGSSPRYVPIYRAPSSGRIVLPMVARGMWSTIYYYLALEADLNTIAGAAIYKHGETPGIGDRIEDRDWLASWRGKQAYDESGIVAIGFGRSAARREPQHRIDGITGATVTVSGLDGSIRYWLSESGYRTALAELFGQD